jgi:hypothetical protein
MTVSSSSTRSWGTLLAKARKGRSIPPGLTLCLDPGETMGWSLWRDGLLENSGQFKIGSMTEVVMFITGISPERVVMEEYRVYSHRADQHIGSEVITIQYIGVIKLACEQLKIALHTQAAWQAKGFATDDMGSLPDRS